MILFSLILTILISITNAVEVDNDVGGSGSLQRLRSTDEASLRFLSLGDWGGNSFADQRMPYTNPIQLKVANAAALVARRRRPTAFVSVGDNFYQSGVVDDLDPRFNYTFERVYSHRAFQRPWYLVLGNHDHERNASAQLAYSRRSSRWRMPSEFYTHTFYTTNDDDEQQNQEEEEEEEEEEEFSVEFIFLDTSLLIAERMRRPFALVDRRYARSIRAMEASAWLNRTMDDSLRRNATWLIVVGHHPIMSVGEYGGTPTLIRRLQPRLEQQRAALYISGHSHSLQYMSHNDVEYIVNGAGGMINYHRWNWFNVPRHSLQFCYPRGPSTPRIGQRGGFVFLEFKSAKLLTIDFYNEVGEVIYSVEKSNPRRP